MMMSKIDRKGRVHLPKSLRKRLGLKENQIVGIKISDNSIKIDKLEGRAAMDSVLRDMIEHPLHSKVPVTKELLDRLADEQWSGL